MIQCHGNRENLVFMCTEDYVWENKEIPSSEAGLVMLLALGSGGLVGRKHHLGYIILTASAFLFIAARGSDLALCAALS